MQDGDSRIGGRDGIAGVPLREVVHPLAAGVLSICQQAAAPSEKIGDGGIIRLGLEQRGEDPHRLRVVALTVVADAGGQLEVRARRVAAGPEVRHLDGFRPGPVP